MVPGMSTFTEAFNRFTGGAPPLLVIGAAVLLALVLLPWLGRNGFRIRRPGLHRGLLYAPVLAAGLAILMIGVDIASPYAADINVRFPASLAFYPVIGFVAEVAFHLLPLALLLGILRPLTPRLGPDRVVWLALGATALIEPVFQLVLAGPGGYPVWQVAYMTTHIFGFNLLQLWIFRRYDFLSMYLFRLVYYLIWHIAWGHVRLDLLF